LRNFPDGEDTLVVASGDLLDPLVELLHRGDVGTR
jgi:hypothetical protein